MVCLARTKDERFLLQLYQMTLDAPEGEDTFVMEEVGKAAGLSPKAVKTIAVLLAQANFILKSREGEISITPHGKKLAEELLS